MTPTKHRWLLAAGAWLLAGALLAEAQEATIAGTVDGTVNIRAAADPRSEIIGQLPDGEAVSLIGRDASGRWLAMTYGQGEGWLPAFSVITGSDWSVLPVRSASDSAPDSEVVIEAFGRVNVRAAPTVTSEVVGQLSGGEVVPVLGRDGPTNDWLLIQLPETADTQGWVAYFTVGVQGDPNGLPMLAVDAADAVVLPEALVNARFNARLHIDPALASPVLAVVPFGGQVEPIARTADSAWLYVRFGEVVGWGAARLFDLPRSRADALPEFVPLLAEATPEAGGS